MEKPQPLCGKFVISTGAQRSGEICGSSADRLVNELQGELNLAGCAGGTADLAEACSCQGIGRQAHIHNVEQVEELGAKLQIHQLDAARTPAERCALDQGKVEVIVGRP